MKTLLLILVLLVLIGCKSEITEISDSPLDTQTGCEAPYIGSEPDCCLDENGDGVCDSEDLNGSVLGGEVPASVEAPAVIEEPEVPVKLCEIKGKVTCNDIRADRDSIQLFFRNNQGRVFASAGLRLGEERTPCTGPTSIVPNEYVNFTCPGSFSPGLLEEVIYLEYTDAMNDAIYSGQGEIAVMID
jgi:hypothetical protein